VTLKRQDTLGSGLIVALEAAWAAIREIHSVVPPAVIVTGAGSIGGRGRLRLGHFAATRWRAGQEGELCEVFVGGEGLVRGAAAVLGTLLHEAAHALAHARGIKETSRQGRYHNRNFKELAEELGLSVAHDPQLGWSPTTLTEDAAATYAQPIAALDAAITSYRRSEDPSGATRGASRNLIACVCRCGRRLRMARSVLAAGPVICGVCNTGFVPEGE
jgi:hypothetical protein